MKQWGGFIFAFMLMICGAVLPCNGQIVPDSTAHDRYALYYFRDRIDIDKEYLDNAYQISRIKNILSRSTRIDSIVVYAYASPEGSPSRNRWLAERRASAARDFILNNLPANSTLSPENIILRPMGENWEGLEAELEENYHLPNRDRVMRIIRSRVNTETKKWRLQHLDNGYTYRLIIRNHMPKLRLATWICVYVPFGDLRIDFVDDTLEAPKELQPIEPVQADIIEHKTIMAVKSNLLYDALSLVNYSIEVPITKHFSALIYHQFPWWRWGEAKNEYCIRFLSAGAEARWWFYPMPRTQYGRERDKLMGHFIGVYAESGMWDFQWERNICYQGEHWSAGVSYGYSMSIGKRLNLEFSISAGYAEIPFRKFVPSSDYEILWADPVKHGTWHYFGPTKAQVTLTIPITVKTKRKGGDR